MQELAGILAVIGVFFVPMAMIVLIMWFKSSEKRKRYRLQADIYIKALEKGQSVPDSLFAERQNPQKPAKKRRPLNRGIIYIAVGIGVALVGWFGVGPFLDSSSSDKVASLGIIPFLIGVAYVIIHFIEKKQGAGEQTR